jgi:hypothetical protein
MSPKEKEKEYKGEERRKGIHRYENGIKREVWTEEDRKEFTETYARLKPYLDRHEDEVRPVQKKPLSKFHLPLIGE